ncbi:mitochondrial carrier domain-containing protein [Sphaerosporella brunnea]|uniref:Mitochondrial carrier domain-containing protein n=1 Tax=Sphaerosporella brunnea TaxID=1250544 RepID=A0A5J5ESS3_9PEZI|nr:mitochondrial carrier domain-containing protein [Sphaerosporella brunnea]
MAKEKHAPFWFGGSASCMAAVCTHPLDLVKVRLQTAGKLSPGMAKTAINILEREGIRGLYSGLSASLLRQVTYSTTRFGAYDAIKNVMTPPGGQQPGFATLVFISFGAGAIGGLAGNSADIINVRMQQDLANPPEKRRNYKNAFDGLVRMMREEGPTAMFRGVWPNILRAGLMTASQLATYDQAKALLLKLPFFEDGVTTHFSASLLSGLIATTICSPVDVIKTRVMSSHDAQGILHLLTDITKHEGLKWVFRGWVPSFMRLGPQTILTFVALEQHKRVWRWLNEEKHSEAAI